MHYIAKTITIMMNNRAGGPSICACLLYFFPPKTNSQAYLLIFSVEYFWGSREICDIVTTAENKPSVFVCHSNVEYGNDV